jgi:hypothetical protein
MHILGRFLVIALLVALALVLYALDSHTSATLLAVIFAPVCFFILICGEKL